MVLNDTCVATIADYLLRVCADARALYGRRRR